MIAQPHQSFPVPARKGTRDHLHSWYANTERTLYKSSMILQSLEALQNLEKTLREEFAESTNLELCKQMLILELREVEQERNDWKTKCERYEQERDAWRIKSEQQLINVQNLESFPNAVEMQVLVFETKV